jgi:hypothetical protein
LILFGRQKESPALQGFQKSDNETIIIGLKQS